MGFTPGTQGWFKIGKSTNKIHHMNRLKKKDHVFLSVDKEKACKIIEHPLMIKTKNRRVHPQLDKGHLHKKYT